MCLTVILLLLIACCVEGFVHSGFKQRHFMLYSTPGEPITNSELDAVKKKLYSNCAKFDRGFSIDQENQSKVLELVKDMQRLMIDASPTKGFKEIESISVLSGNWQMIWTNAYDVLALNLSPVTIVQGIYQSINAASGEIVNIIDLAPRIEQLFPSTFASRLRLKVYTEGRKLDDNRIGLIFRKVEPQVKSVLGFKVPTEIPKLSFNLPSLNIGNNDSGYFTVLYVDDDTLIIQQNFGAGIFVSVKVNSV